MEWLKLFHRATLFFSFCYSNHNLSLHFCFASPITCFYLSTTQSLYMRKAKLGPWSAPSHSFILRHTSAFSSQVSLHLSPQHFSNRSSGDGSHNKQQEIMWDSHHHTSAGVRSPAPASTFKKEPKKNQFMPWWDSDCNQHPVTHHNDKIHCAIVRDESTPWLHSCLQFPAKLFHHLFQEWSLPRIFSQIY